MLMWVPAADAGTLEQAGSMELAQTPPHETVASTIASSNGESSSSSSSSSGGGGGGSGGSGSGSHGTQPSSSFLPISTSAPISWQCYWRCSSCWGAYLCAVAISAFRALSPRCDSSEGPACLPYKPFRCYCGGVRGGKAGGEGQCGVGAGAGAGGERRGGD
ncbi:hypothetical protein CLOM_g9782 [Closterium sp. NIES-68]|nr:hypothetical protein CLOM_g9782 [Closterium sp. NIES-68]GJP69882.1 hypothetical protein CLOP_g884 [Closterium sp. NIES-67]